MWTFLEQPRHFVVKYEVLCDETLVLSILNQCQLQWSTNTLTLLNRFGGIDIKAVLGTEFLQNPLNAFTSSYDLHSEFDELNLWLAVVTLPLVPVA